MVGDTRSSNEINLNLSRSNINSAAEMFIALNFCPSFYVKLYWKAIYGNESRMAKFASNIIRKAKDDFKVKAQKMFAKISSVIGFQHISLHHIGNRSNAMNIKLSKNIMDIKGIKYLSGLIANSIFLAPTGVLEEGILCVRVCPGYYSNNSENEF